jgi:hypothetical protein
MTDKGVGNARVVDVRRHPLDTARMEVLIELFGLYFHP